MHIAFPPTRAGKVICASCISSVGFTGCEYFVHSRSFASYVVNVFGTDQPPDDWEYDPPGWRDVARAFAEGPQTYVPRLRR